jgi:hypothetical protein
MVLSDRCVLRACAADGGQYVVAGSKSKSRVAILVVVAEIGNRKNRCGRERAELSKYIPGRREMYVRLPELGSVRDYNAREYIKR